MAQPIQNLNEFDANSAGNLEEIEMQFVSVNKHEIGVRGTELLLLAYWLLFPGTNTLFVSWLSMHELAPTASMNKH